MLLLCKTDLEQSCTGAFTPVQICCAYRGAVTQHQTTATVLETECKHLWHPSALQNSFGKNSVASAVVTEKHKLMNVNAVAQDYCQLVLHTSTK